MKNINSNMIDGHAAARRVAEQKKDSQNKNSIQSTASNPLFEDNTKTVNSYSMPKQSLWEKTKSKARQAVLGTAVSAQVAAPIAGGISSAQTIGTVATVAVAANSLQSCVTQTVDLGPITAQLQVMSEQLKELMKLIGDGNAKISAQLAELIEKYESGLIELKDLMNQIVGLLEQSNMNDKELMAKIDGFIKQYEQNQISQDKMFAEIIKEIQNVNKSLKLLVDIKESIDNLGDKVDQSNQDVVSAINKFMEEYKKGNLSMSALINKVIGQLGDANGISVEILKKITELCEKYEGGGMTESELLQKILDALNDIKDIAGSILEQVTQLNANFTKFSEKYDANQATLFEKMDNLFNGLGNMSSKMDQIIANGETSNTLLQQLTATATGAQKTLENIEKEIGKTNVTLGDILNHDKESHKVLVDLLTKMGIAIDNSLTVEQLDELLNKYKTNLTTTNGLLQTQIGLLEALVNKGTDGVDLTEVTRLLNEINNANKEGNTNIDAKMAELNELLAQILANTGTIIGQLDEILKKMDTMLENYTESKAAAAEYAAMVKDQLGSMSSLMSTYATKMDGFITKQLASQDQIQVQLNEIINKKGGSLTKEEMQDIMKDYPGMWETTNELLANLNNDKVTNATLNAALSANKTNLTTTNALIQTGIGLLEAISNMGGVGGGNVDTSGLESKMGQILTQLASNQATSSSEQQALKDEIVRLQNIIKEQGGATAMNSVQSKKYDVILNTLQQGINAEKQGKTINNKLYANLIDYSIKSIKSESDNQQYKYNTYYGFKA